MVKQLLEGGEFSANWYILPPFKSSLVLRANRAGRGVQTLSVHFCLESLNYPRKASASKASISSPRTCPLNETCSLANVKAEKIKVISARYSC